MVAQPQAGRPRADGTAGNAGDTVSLVLAGDVNLQDREDPAEAFRHVLPVLRAADIVFGNLEGPLSPPSQDPAAPDIPHKPGWRHSGPAMVKGLVAAGFDAAGCANNVTFPPRALLDSLATLDAAGIAHCGGGRNLAEAHRPAIVVKRGVRVGFLQYTCVFAPVGQAAGPESPGVATVKIHTSYQPGRRALEMPGDPPIVITTPDPHELAMMVEDVRQLRAQVDVLVASFHWGISGSRRVVDYQRAVGRAAIDAGADIVIGHGPHEIQEVEVWQGRPIFHSLANFVFDWESMRRRRDGLLVRCLVRDRRVARVSLLPLRRDEQNNPVLLDPARGEGLAIVETMRRLASDGGACLRLDGQEVVITGAGSPLPAGDG